MTYRPVQLDLFIYLFFSTTGFHIWESCLPFTCPYRKEISFFLYFWRVYYLTNQSEPLFLRCTWPRSYLWFYIPTQKCLHNYFRANRSSHIYSDHGTVQFVWFLLAEISYLISTVIRTNRQHGGYEYVWVRRDVLLESRSMNALQTQPREKTFGSAWRQSKKGFYFWQESSGTKLFSSDNKLQKTFRLNQTPDTNWSKKSFRGPGTL